MTLLHTPLEITISFQIFTLNKLFKKIGDNRMSLGNGVDSVHSTSCGLVVYRFNLS